MAWKTSWWLNVWKSCPFKVTQKNKMWRETGKEKREGDNNNGETGEHEREQESGAEEVLGQTRSRGSKVLRFRRGSGLWERDDGNCNDGGCFHTTVTQLERVRNQLNNSIQMCRRCLWWHKQQAIGTLHTAEPASVTVTAVCVRRLGCVSHGNITGKRQETYLDSLLEIAKHIIKSVTSP